MDKKTWAKLVGDTVIALFTANAGWLSPVLTKVREYALDRYFERQESKELRASLQKMIEQCLPGQQQKEQRALVEACALLCLKEWDAIKNYDPEEAAKQLSEEFLEKYKNQYSEGDIQQLENHLVDCLCSTIKAIEIKKEEDPKFRQQWKVSIEQRLETVERQTAENTKAIAAMDGGTASSGTVEETTQKYRNKWKAPMVLENENQEENGKNLCECYQIPRCQLKFRNGPDEQKSLEACLRDFLSPEGDSFMLVLLGQPGCGKSTAIAWLLNQEDLLNGRKVRVYRWADFEEIKWTGSKINNLPNRMLRAARLNPDDLNNSILILDGLDEVNLNGKQTELLSALEVWSEQENFRLIITCRTNRIVKAKPSNQKIYWELCPFAKDEILEFAEKYAVTQEYKETLQDLLEWRLDLTEVLGIPFLLYMVLNRKVPLTEQIGLIDIYSQVFSTTTEYSIYQRSKYDQQHELTGKSPEKIHEFSKQVAVTMWADAPEQASIARKEAEVLAAGQGGMALNDILIGQYFIEGKKGQELYFIHRSIYEYFTALSLCECMAAAQGYGTVEKLFQTVRDRSPAPQLTALADMLAKNNLCDFPEIQKFVRLMMQKPGEEQQSRLSDICKWWIEFIQTFVTEGLAFAASEAPNSVNAGMFDERIRLCNLLILVRTVLEAAGQSKPYTILDPKNIPLSFFAYMDEAHRRRTKHENKVISSTLDLRWFNLSGMNLSGAHLEDAHLSGAHLSVAHLERAHLEDAHLENAHLENAHLERAHLSGAHLREACLGDAHLENAHLERANLEEARLRLAHLEGANLKVAHLLGAHLEDAHLKVAHLGSARLEKAHLERADLTRAYLWAANLEFAHLEGANLTGADLTNAITDYIKIDSFRYNGPFRSKEEFYQIFGSQLKSPKTSE